MKPRRVQWWRLVYLWPVALAAGLLYVLATPKHRRMHERE